MMRSGRSNSNFFRNSGRGGVETTVLNLKQSLKRCGQTSFNDSNAQFYPFSDLKRVWEENNDAAISLVLPGIKPYLTGAIKRKEDGLLRFLSFVVVHHDNPKTWLGSLTDKLFAARASTSSLLLINDSKMPMTREDFIDHGFAELVAISRYQYEFFPLQLDFDDDEKKPHIISNESRLFPFVKVKESTPTVSGNIDICTIHPDNVRTRLTLAEDRVVVVKSYGSNRATGKREMNNMLKLKRASAHHDNILYHLTILDHEQKERNADRCLYIVFPRAERPDLQQLIKNTNMFNTSQEPSNVVLARILLTQCRAIVDAVRFLHNGLFTDDGFFVGLHLDLKPENIIIFNNCGAEIEFPNATNDELQMRRSIEQMVGTWKICDFGISVFRAAPEEGRPLLFISQRLGGDYQPPEVCKNSMVGFPVDVWSCGAILTDIFAFALGRSDAFARFVDQRTVYNPYRNSFFYSNKLTDASFAAEGVAGIRPGAQKWLDQAVQMYASQPDDWMDRWKRCIMTALIIKAEERSSISNLLRSIQTVWMAADAEIKQADQRAAAERQRQPDPVEEAVEENEGEELPDVINRRESIVSLEPLPWNSDDTTTRSYELKEHVKASAAWDNRFAHLKETKISFFSFAFGEDGQPRRTDDGSWFLKTPHNFEYVIIAGDHAAVWGGSGEDSQLRRFHRGEHQRWLEVDADVIIDPPTRFHTRLKRIALSKTGIIARIEQSNIIITIPERGSFPVLPPTKGEGVFTDVAFDTNYEDVLYILGVGNTRGDKRGYCWYINTTSIASGQESVPLTLFFKFDYESDEIRLRPKSRLIISNAGLGCSVMIANGRWVQYAQGRATFSAKYQPLNVHPYTAYNHSLIMAEKDHSWHKGYSFKFSEVRYLNGPKIKKLDHLEFKHDTRLLDIVTYFQEGWTHMILNFSEGEIRVISSRMPRMQ